MARIDSYRGLDRRYASLRIIAELCTRIGAILLGIGAVLLVAVAYVIVAGMAGVSVRPEILAPALVWMGGAVSLLWSFGILFSGIQLIALGGLLRLMVHLEENTRATAQLLDRIRSRMESGREGVETTFIS